jgi:hypothetical protein
VVGLEDLVQDQPEVPQIAVVDATVVELPDELAQ